MRTHHRLAVATILSLAGLPASIHSPPQAMAALARPETPFDSRVATVISQAGGKIDAEQLGVSRQGRPIHLLRLGRQGAPALLVVAGLNAMHTVGIDAALGLAQSLAKDHADLLASHTVYIIPCADPDSLERLRTASVKRDTARTIAPNDDDHDGRIDEDPPVDLNADGVISLMRVYDPPPSSGIEPTDIIDPEDPRLTKKPDRMKGETANVAILIESRDQDGDGLMGEDGPDATDLTQNFPWHWPEFRDGAGPYPLSEPETRAIAQWLIDHENVVAVLEFGTHDNLVKTPDAGKMDITGRVAEALENDDKPYYEQIGTLFKDATKMTGAPSGDPAGSLYAWAYAHLGLYSFSTPVWVRPDLVKSDEKKDADAKPADAPATDAKPEGPGEAEIAAMIAEFQNAPREKRRELMEKLRTMPQEVQDRVRASFMGAGRGGPGAGGARGPGGSGGGGGARPGARPRSTSDADDAKWLKYSDEQRDSEGFIPFAPFDHPQLGPVEIGGFIPGFKLNPPADQLPALIEQQTTFVSQLLAKLPRIVTDEPTVEPLGPGLYRITLRVSNTGFLPSRTAAGIKARRIPPLRIQIDLPDDRLVSGDRLTRIGSLPGAGGSRTVEWIVRGPEGSTIPVAIKSPDYGDTSLAIPLREHTRKAAPIPQPPAPPVPQEPAQ